MVKELSQRKRKILRDKVFERDGRITADGSVKCKCFYCKKYLMFSEMTMDHIIPISKGGKHKLKNLVSSCEHCNLTKGNKIIRLSIKNGIKTALDFPSALS